MEGTRTISMENVTIENIREFYNSNIKYRLEEFACLEGSEYGEYISGLLYLTQCLDFVQSPFLDALIHELNRQYEIYMTQYRVIERTETRTVTYTELEYKG